MITKKELNDLVDRYGFDESPAFELSLPVIDLRVSGYGEMADELYENQLDLIKEIAKERRFSELDLAEFIELYNAYLC
jgi:hypothetical protein